MALTVFTGHQRDLPARLPRQDAVLRRRGLQTGQGALRRRKGALHAFPDDALRFEYARARPADQPFGP